MEDILGNDYFKSKSDSYKSIFFNLWKKKIKLNNEIEMQGQFNLGWGSLDATEN